MSLENRSQNINLLQQGARWTAEKTVGGLYLNTEVLHKERLKSGQDLLNSGAGLIIDANHFSEREPVDIYRVPFLSPEMRKRPILILVAGHVKQDWFKYAHGAVHSEISYIITQDSIKSYAQQGIDVTSREFRNDSAALLGKAMDRTVDTLESGGIVILFGQGGRRTTMHNSPPNEDHVKLTTLETIHGRMERSAKKKGIELNYEIQPVGISINQEYDREYVKDHVNRKLPYVLDIGVAKHIKNYLGQVNGDYKRLDEVVNGEIEKLVLPNYIGEGPLQADSDFPERESEFDFLKF